MIFKRRAQYTADHVTGQVKLLRWWVTVRRFASMSDALTWLGYDEEEQGEQVP